MGSVEFREKITKAKLRCLFHDAYKVSLLEKELEKRVDEVVTTSAAKERLSLHRDHEASDRRERFYVSELRAHRKAKRIAIAEERRKWAVKYTTKDGKPDKKRRYGRPWDPSVYCPIDRMTYTGAGVDLLAFEKKDPTGLPVGKPGSDESVRDIINQVSLQTYLEQVNHYEQLLNPISEIMQKTMGQPPRARMAAEDLGFGPLGRELPRALSDIGAVPKFWGHSDKEHHSHHKEHLNKKRDKVSLYDLHVPKEKTGKVQFSSQHDDVSISSTSSVNSGELVVRKANAGGPQFVRNKDGTVRQLPVLKDVNMKRKQRIKDRRKSPAVIPWGLLDELEGEKKRFQNEKSYVEFNYKY